MYICIYIYIYIYITVPKYEHHHEDLFMSFMRASQCCAAPCSALQRLVAGARRPSPRAPLMFVRAVVKVFSKVFVEGVGSAT